MAPLTLAIVLWQSGGPAHPTALWDAPSPPDDHLWTSAHPWAAYRNQANAINIHLLHKCKHSNVWLMDVNSHFSSGSSVKHTYMFAFTADVCTLVSGSYATHTVEKYPRSPPLSLSLRFQFPVSPVWAGLFLPACRFSGSHCHKTKELVWSADPPTHTDPPCTTTATEFIQGSTGWYLSWPVCLPSTMNLKETVWETE